MDWLKKFMYGRYGLDQLSLALLLLSLLLSLIISLINKPILSILMYIPLGICYFRIFSKNITKRQQENLCFLKYWNPIKSWFKKYFNRLKDLKTHCYFKCPDCRQTLRVPRGKGNIRITCGRCHHEFKKRT